ncbi:bestrophin-like domain [Massilia horti]|uniref:DUF4239 domain-containing protein n=1 Tax=Massilia horti TaxID=2562153 RepID=A0A4Y9SXC6_9BURK|nr:DUF4239 domain-containing protein [Massilia horti]TFW30197.1 DUF4239 domain-containing protein [Massilia horti]
MLKTVGMLSTPFLIAGHVGFFILATWLLMALIHRVMPVKLRREYNDVIGFLSAVVAVFYGLLIASVLVIAINRFDHAQQVTETESNLVADIVRNAEAISPEIERPVRKLVAQYLTDVIAMEWPAQAKGQESVLATAPLIDLAVSISRYAPQTQREVAYYQQLTGTLTRLYDTRKERIFIADEGIADVVWIVSLAGSLLTICFAMFFGIENRRLHFMLAAFLAVSLALVFALVAIFDRPFQGGLTVSDEPYRLVREQIVQGLK